MKKRFTALFVIILSVTLFYHKEAFLEFVKGMEERRDMMPVFTAVTLIGLKTFATLLGFPGTPFTLLSGSLFGNFIGTVISIIGNTLGAALAFLFARYVFRDYIQGKVVSGHPGMKQYEERLEKRAVSTVIALRLIPLFPFNALNFLFGITNISFKDYIIGSIIGMIPGTFLFVYFGESLRMLSPINITLAVFGIIILTFLGKLYEKKW